MKPWPREKLSNLGTVTTGSTPNTTHGTFYGGEIPFVTPAELDQDAPITMAARTLSEEGASQARLLPAGAVMVCCIGSLGKVGIAGTTVATNQQINSVVFDSNKVSPRFGFYACRLLAPKLEKMAPATTVPIVNKSKFEALEIPLPPLAEQQRIAAILDKADELRAKRRAGLKRLDELPQSIFAELFGRETTILGNWPKKKLGDVLRFITSGSRGWAAHYADSGDLFLRIQNVGRDELLLHDVAYVHAPSTAEAKRTRVEPGDVLLSITADLGRSAVVPEGLGVAFINQHLSILRTSILAPRFLSAYFATSTGQRQVSGRNRHAVKAGLNFDDIRSFVIPVPPMDLQEQFAARVAAVEKLKVAHRAWLAEMDVLFASLQHRAFRGEL